MSEWFGDYTLKKASEVRRGDFISVDGYWLEVISVRPTGSPEVLEDVLTPQSYVLAFINGRHMTVRRDEELMVR